MKKVIATLLALAMCGGLLAGCSGTVSGTEGTSTSGGITILNVGTGSVGGTDNTVVEAISSVVNQNTGLKTSTITTAGGTEIIHLLETGDIQAGYPAFLATAACLRPFSFKMRAMLSDTGAFPVTLRTVVLPPLNIGFHEL